MSAAATLESLQPVAAALFRQAVEQAMRSPSFDRPRPLLEMRELVEDFALYGLRCRADADAALIPEADRLTWHAWSRETITVRGFAVTVRVRAFHLIGHGVHVEVSSPDRSPLPFTATGYQSLFVPFAQVVDFATPREFIEQLFPATPMQASLF